MLKIDKNKMVSYDLIIYKKLRLIKWFSFILIALELLIPTTRGDYLDTSCVFAYIMCIIIYFNYRTNTMNPNPKFLVIYWIILRVIWAGLYFYKGWMDGYTTALISIIEITYFAIVILVRDSLEMIDKETDEEDFKYVNGKQIQRLKINPSEFHGNRHRFVSEEDEKLQEEIGKNNLDDDW